MALDPARFRQIAEEAQHAFWTKVAELIPEAETGDFPPDATAAFDDACTRAVDDWVAWNVK